MEWREASCRQPNNDPDIANNPDISNNKPNLSNNILSERGFFSTFHYYLIISLRWLPQTSVAAVKNLLALCEAFLLSRCQLNRNYSIEISYLINQGCGGA